MATKETAIQVAEDQSAFAQIRSLVHGRRADIAEVLPKTIDSDRYLKIILATVHKSEALAKCSPVSILRSIVEAASWGLEPTGLWGGGWLVPFWNSNKKVNEAQFIMSYVGLMQIVRGSGEIESIESHIVYEGDEFELVRGSRQELRHVPKFASNEPRLAYAIARMKSGAWVAEVMPVAQIEKVRAASKASNAGPWVSWWDEMARKTVARRLCKWLPIPSDVRRQMAEEDGEIPTRIEIEGKVDEEPLPELPAPQAGLKAKLAAQRQRYEDDKRPDPPAEPATLAELEA